jgi:hypothetical protein
MALLDGPDAPSQARAEAADCDILALLGLDRLPARPGLCCRWRRDADGRLVAYWEVDLVQLR